MVGVGDVLQQSPFSVTADSPASVTLPPQKTEVVKTVLKAFVFTVGAPETASSLRTQRIEKLFEKDAFEIATSAALFRRARYLAVVPLNISVPDQRRAY